MGKFFISLGAAGIAATLIALALPHEIFAEKARPAAAVGKSGPAHPQQPKAIALPPLQGPF